MSRISRLHTNTKGDCSEVRSSGDSETSDEVDVCETNVQLSDIPKPCEDLSQIFPNGITTFFQITTRVPCTCLFSRTCSNSLLIG
ncbi:hypothetical protein QL285_032988 [Trifolium repens]|nr:hypothetical protein QL285_032988 [Trifolium repens]